MPRRMRLPHSLFGVAWCCFVGLPSASAQSGTIELTQLPAPPSAIAELIHRADVQFTYGAKEMPSTTSMTVGRRHDTLTEYRHDALTELHLDVSISNSGAIARCGKSPRGCDDVSSGKRHARQQACRMVSRPARLRNVLDQPIGFT